MGGRRFEPGIATARGAKCSAAMRRVGPGRLAAPCGSATKATAAFRLFFGDGIRAFGREPAYTLFGV